MLSMLIESIKEKLGELSSWSGGLYWNRNTNLLGSPILHLVPYAAQFMVYI